MGNLNWYAADFETAADPIAEQKEKTYVWAWGLTKISEKDEDFYYGTDILSFVTKSLELGGTYWFHNEKFDGSFIISFLLNNGFSFTNKNSFDMPDYSYNVICNSMGQIYKISYKVNNKLIKIQNSLLKIPGTIRGIAKSLKLDVTKGDIDYTKYREESADDLDPVDKDYLERDVRILAKAMYSMHLKNNNLKLTIGADCLEKYKETIKHFDDAFPKLDLELDTAIRKAYYGGYVYVNPKFKNLKIAGGATFDKNSMYPGVMHSKSRYLFPYGMPKYFEGEYKQNKEYPIFIQRVKVTAKLKKDRWPTINLGAAFSKSGHSEYVNEIDNQELTLTDVDLLWLHRNYDVENIEEIDGYMFKATRGLFDKYIDTYMELKERATIAKDPVQRQLAKLMLNNLYGKFGTNPIRISKIPILDKKKNKLVWLREDIYYKEKLKHTGVDSTPEGLGEYKPAGYIPVAVFTTTYARNELWSAIDKVWKYFIYCDTDSIHILMGGLDIALNNLDIHDTRLGAWAHESNWLQGIFLRAKTYAELQLGEFKDDGYGDRVFKAKLDGTETNWDIKACGCPENVKEQINIEDFKIGTIWASKKYLATLTEKEKNKLFKENNVVILKGEGKLMPKQVDGGTILVETTFRITK